MTLGTLHRISGRHDESPRLLREGPGPLTERVGATRDVAVASLERTGAHVRRGDFPAAREALADARRRAEALCATDLLLHVEGVESMLQSQAGDLEAALAAMWLRSRALAAEIGDLNKITSIRTTQSPGHSTSASSRPSRLWPWGTGSSNNCASWPPVSTRSSALASESASPPLTTTPCTPRARLAIPSKSPICWRAAAQACFSTRFNSQKPRRIGRQLLNAQEQARCSRLRPAAGRQAAGLEVARVVSLGAARRGPGGPPGAGSVPAGVHGSGRAHAAGDPGGHGPALPDAGPAARSRSLGRTRRKRSSSTPSSGASR